MAKAIAEDGEFHVKELSEDEMRAKENSLILDVYNYPISNLLVSCSDKLREIIPYDHSFTGFNDQSNRIGATFNYRSSDTDPETLELYAKYYYGIDYLSWCYNQALPMTFRSTDLLKEEAIEQSRIHREWHSRMGVFYSVTLCAAANGILYGTLTLMRSKKHGDFSDIEVALLSEVNQHLCNRFRLTYPNGINRYMMDASSDPIAAVFSFTPREWEIVCLLMQGLSRTEIADKLNISKNTLKRHVANIYAKIDVSNMRQFFSALDKVDKSVQYDGLKINYQRSDALKRNARAARAFT